MYLLLQGLLILLLQAPVAESQAPADPAATTPAAVDTADAVAAEQTADTDSGAAEDAAAAALVEALATTDQEPAAPADAPAEDSETQEDAASATTSGRSPFTILLLLVAVVAIPLLAGNYISRAIQAPEWSSRIAVVTFVLTIGLLPFVTSLIDGIPIAERFRLGIDLAGGTNMVFQVRGGEKEITPQVMDQMVGAVSRRINQSGTEEITVRAVGTDRIEVIVPGEDAQTVDDIKRRIVRLGSLEFFVVANQTDSAIVRQARSMDLSQKDVVINGEVLARWIQAAEKDGDPKLLQDPEAISRSLQATREVNGRVQTYSTEEYLLLLGTEEERVTGQFLSSAVPDIDQQTGELVVSFVFDTHGSFLFSKLTGDNRPREGVPRRRLAIVLDGRLDSAPYINEQINGRGQISGGGSGFSRTEADELVSVLNAGALEVPIDPKPLSEATVDPTLGQDVREKGITATAISGVLVMIFMLVYYRVAGLIAVISLILNLILTLGAMVSIPATFTLPGIAGLVLTIGMAVDANVLIYERMREELQRGAGVKIAIQNGFEKAFITIFDSNITTLLTSIVLFYFGTDQIRGFAVTLFIGLAISMFTALYVGRLLFDIAERTRLLRNISMLKLVGETNFDFMKYRKLLFTGSACVIALGLAAFTIRGEKNYDIDFTGGTMVAFQMTEPQNTTDVAAALQQEFGDDFSLERLTIGGEKEEGRGRYFRLRSTERDSGADDGTAVVAGDSAEDRVRERVYAAFRNSTDMKLRMVSLEFSEITAVEVDETDDSVEAVKRLQFRDGLQSELTFSEELAMGTATDLIAAKLSEARGAEVEGLFGLEGLEGSGVNASARSVRKYTRYAVRVLPDVTSDQLNAALNSARATLSQEPLFDEVNTFASAVAQETRADATVAVLLSILGISAYIWFRFQNIVFGLAAVVSLVHDVLITVGSVAVAGLISGNSVADLLLIDDFRINLPMIAAFLTLVGYSLNDTIVVFDRIREVRGKNPKVTNAIVNTSLNQTLARTLMTGVTVFIVVIILYVFGGSGVHGFAWCLLIGSISGTYSSVYIASPFLVWFLDRSKAISANA